MQLERLGEIFDGARILSHFGPGKAAAAVNRLLRLARLEIAIECLDDLGKAAHPEQGLRARRWPSA